MSGRCLAMHPDDDVATALEDIPAGTAVAPEGADAPVITAAAIPFGHKLALRAIAAGEPVRKYGEIIGTASVPITAGEHVHVHNLESGRARGDRP